MPALAAAASFSASSLAIGLGGGGDCENVGGLCAAAVAPAALAAEVAVEEAAENAVAAAAVEVVPLSCFLSNSPEPNRRAVHHHPAALLVAAHALCEPHPLLV